MSNIAETKKFFNVSIDQYLDIFNIWTCFIYQNKFS